MTPAPAPELSEALAGRYRVERELGRGGMATVYLADDLKHDRRVAIKVLDPDLPAALGAERFAREIAVTARLQHSHILPLFNSGHAGALLYYVMPYVDGETLRQRMDREGQLAIDDTLRIIGDVASALSYAHEHGVIHRDVKPENILLQGDHALVADFGIAGPLNDAERDRLTQSGVALGTPRYMSPEQASTRRRGASDRRGLVVGHHARVVPDGKRVAFGRGTGVNARAIYVADVNGDGPPSKIVDGIDITAPRWSPDASSTARVCNR